MHFAVITLKGAVITLKGAVITLKGAVITLKGDSYFSRTSKISKMSH